ncbi:MAG: ATP-binding protein [Victivallaceae bacterium]|nr:ATP-binding protein [Victivallaceae bacterium]
MSLWRKIKAHMPVIAVCVCLFILIPGGIFAIKDQSAAAPRADFSQSRDKKNVLVFLSAHATNLRTANWLTELNAWAQNHPKFQINLNVVELDVLRNSDSGDWMKEIQHELPAIQNHHYDLIVTLDNVALDCLIRKEHQLPPRLPVVFSGYEKNPDALLKIHPNMTGIQEVLDLAKNIELGLQLWPDTHEAIILSDSSPDSLAIERQAKRKLQNYKKIQLTFLDNSKHSVSELFAILRSKERHTFLVFPPWRTLAQSDYQTRSAMAMDLSANLRIPYLVLTDELLGNGAIGGFLVPVRELARKTTAMASQVLDRASAEGLAIRSQTPTPRFDSVALKKAGISDNMLPPESVILNQPPDMWERNHRFFIGISGLFLMLLAAISIYTTAVRRTLKRSRSLYASLPGRIGVINQKERVLYLNTEDGCRAELKDVKFFREIPNINYQKLSEAFHEVFRTGKSITIEYEYKSVKRILAASLLDETLFGEKAVVWFSQDNTTLHNVVQNEQAVKESLSSLMLEPSFSGAFERIANSLNLLLDCDRVLLAKCNEEGMLRLYEEWHASNIIPLKDTDLTNHYRVWDSYCDRLRTWKLIKFDDLNRTGIPQKYHLNEHGYRSPASVIISAIFLEGRLWGALFVSFHKAKRSFSASDEQLMHSMSDIIALAIVRENQQNEIRRSNFEKQIILDHVNIPIWLYDGNGALLQANNQVAKIAGVPADSLDTKTNMEIFCKDLPAGIERPIAAVIRTHKPAQLTISYAGRNYISQSLPVLNEQQELIYIVKSAIDVTELNDLIKMQKMVRFCLETFFLESDVNNALELVIKAICEYMDASRCFVMKFDTKTMQANTLAEYIRPGCKPFFKEVKDRHFDPNDPWIKAIMDHELISVDNMKTQEAFDLFGSCHEICENAGAIHTIGLFLEGAFWGTIGISSDKQTDALTRDEMQFIRTAGRIVSLFLQRKKAQEQIMSSLAMARDANKTKSFFIASVSHEIRTPLNAVIGFSELLNDDKLTPSKRKEYLDNIIYSGNTLLQLLNDVLDLSKLESDQMPILRERTDFVNLSEEIMLIFSQMAHKKNISLITRIPELPEMLIDKLRIRQILFNLLGNAVKFTQAGSVTLWAEFLPENETTGTLRFGVSDTGIGIAKNDQEKLLEPFVQLSKLRGTNAANNGTGLGLPICKRLIEKMNGTLSIASTVGKGSTFSVILHDVESHWGNRIAASSSTTRPAGLTTNHVLSLLLVDDVQMNLKVMSAILQKLGIADVVCVQSGEEALAQLRERSFHVVMTDMWMPNMNGAELAREIHALDSCRNLPVIAVTADVEAQGNFPMDDFAGVVLKPVTSAKCAEVLAQIRP